jgi:S1-C subfamily serine protease
MELGQSLYGVVLLVVSLEGGLASYGSGVVVDDQGTVVTNLHVVDKGIGVHALTYDPDKPSYAAVDGGLPRLVFEREKDLIPVRIVRGDPILDLAVVRLEKPARVLPMKMAPRDAVIGEPIVALGHPEQNFWTATRGHVSAIHQGLIQHDASINKGNSGGPLLDEKLQVIGINTMLLKGAQGISYARPVALTGKLLDKLSGPVVLDRSTPEKAIESCNRTRELGDPSFSQCVNWGSYYAGFRDTLLQFVDGRGEFRDGFVQVMSEDPERAAIIRGGPKSRARKILRDWLEKGDGRPERWVQEYGPFAMGIILSDDLGEHGRAAA